ncbi:MAG: succinate dehydrogenase [Ardenticatenaceae bacterium]|nr:succinate dehydrogenase [Ardenticatenaceae bacterium]
MAAATGNITRRKIQRQASLERVAFMFMRMSGIALLILAVGHMMIQHVLNSSANLTLQFVAAQWDAWGWKVYDMLLLIFAYFHGINGLRNILEDYIHNRSLMKNISIILAVFAVITVLWAGFAIASFNPEAVR